MKYVIVVLVILAVLFFLKTSMYTPCSDTTEYKSGFRCRVNADTEQTSVLCRANCEAPNTWTK